GLPAPCDIPPVLRARGACILPEMPRSSPSEVARAGTLSRLGRLRCARRGRPKNPAPGRERWTIGAVRPPIAMWSQGAGLAEALTEAAHLSLVHVGDPAAPASGRPAPSRQVVVFDRRE